MPDAPARKLLAYGMLGIPLAFAGLPVYVHVPQFYARTMGIDLALLGSLLLLIRLGDAVIDPFIGLLSDRFRRWRTAIMMIAALLLQLGYAGLFSPPDGSKALSQVLVLPWLCLCLTTVYLAFSTLMINYYAMALDVAHSYHDNTRAAAFREGCMLIGVLLASLLPAYLLRSYEPRDAYRLFSFSLLPLLAAGMYLTLRHAPPAVAHTQHGASFRSLLKDPQVRWVLCIAFCNAIPTAITSTLFLFFASDVLHLESYSGPLLALYFLSAAAGMPVWTSISRWRGKKWSLRLAMAVAITCFIWAWELQGGDLLPFAVICVLSGMTMGADVTLLPSILADTLQERREATATAFGLWNLCSKLTMAMAAGIALPLLAMGGYHPGTMNTPQALAQLSLCYALLPCLFKLIALVFLHFSPLDPRRTL